MVTRWSPAPARPTPAREVLAARRSASGTGPKRPAKAAPQAAPAADAGPPPPPGRRGAPSAGEPRPAAAPARAATPADEPAAPAPAAAPPSPARPAAAGGAALPTVGELERAWEDTIRQSLPNKIRSRFVVGRFLGVDDGVVRFGLPNAMTVQRCEDLRPEVEQAFEAHFAIPVPFVLVVDDDAKAPPVRGAAVAPAPVEHDDAVDLNELTDADVGSTDTVERIAQVFPGAELVEDLDR